MRDAKYRREIEQLLAEDRELSTEDFMKTCAGMPPSSVYSIIRKLVISGRICKIGRSLYLPIHKPAYPYTVTPWMREVAHLIQNECIGLNFSIIQRDGNLNIEAAKSDLLQLETCLKQHYPKVARQKDAKRFLPGLEGYILIGPIISDAPLVKQEGICVPSIEKDLVDMLALKRNSQDTINDLFQKTMEVYPINENKLRRYAARRGLKEELKRCTDVLDNSRLELFSMVQDYLAGTSITKAWVFGSFARREETPESDLDLLVDYDKSVTVSLLDIIRNQLDLERLIHRPVDLVVNGTLKPFAVPSADKDKYLIYER